MSTQTHPPLHISPPPAATGVRHVSVFERVRYVPGEVHGAILLQNERLRQVLFCVAAGNDLPRHRATCDVAVTVIEGAGTLVLDDGAPLRLRPGVHLVMPEGTPHAVEAETDLALLATFASPTPAIHFLDDE
ncbi:MAG TPA: cupin domain-containing protein [Rubricoccaceae bacterium]|jgi:quercetin dioxygenase-like cupin family protein|nr:cupin domain-containing protein [Rubricoccaceae bacterium]